MLRYQFPGDNMPGVPPVPIPNTAVKPRAADGSRTLGPARVGRCQVYAPSVSPTLGALFCLLARRFDFQSRPLPSSLTVLLRKKFQTKAGAVLAAGP